ncbi:5-carboxymethyl-2-hydroxymuconate Delta-isomerase [Ichthyenterobacterium magnum]|uniref:5-carboxymethyl-2-hydroxymuconate isomerase n=1 Tax=Ichthyenterobacterium magnum TaxID=1230530 RepID=A0A420DXH8_9FLAO|nr:5-carboxymethyl-2-hydroxymuconate Delta-isomerase [Ichthyenterobacterium magnum]RKE98906.1 5-carboxymethyl-2-hydroxymuconate isomerase [Ichthyenterobacterium magnum]
MPHFVIDCSQHILEIKEPQAILQEVHQAANDSNLFEEADIKVRLNPFKENYLVGGKEENFIHVFANIMEGRSTEEKANLSKDIVNKLKIMFPNIPFIAININDFEKATYRNKAMV